MWSVLDWDREGCEGGEGEVTVVVLSVTSTELILQVSPSVEE